MPELTLQVGEERPISTSKRYLNILQAENNFTVESPEIGVLTGKTGKHFEMGDYRSVNFVNNTDAPIKIEYEIANIKTTSSGEANVNVQNEVVVSRIVEAIQVNANATVENGKMSNLTANAFAPIALAKTTIGAGQTVEVLASRVALNRSIVLQLLTDSTEMSEIRVGSSLANAADGIFMRGNKKAPAQFIDETEAAIFVHNPTASSVTIAGGEKWRA